jgi:FkbM family methyltransferase
MIVQSLKKVAASFGISVSRIPSKAALEESKRAQAEAHRKAEEHHLKWLLDLNIRTVLDIGANVGQFAGDVSRLMPQARLYSFEPLPDCYQELVRSGAGRAHFTAFNVALGEAPGEVVMHRNEYSPSSSILPMADLHKNNFTFAVDSKPETIRVARLDDFASELELEQPLLIKVDVQGFEDKVIRGGRAVFGMASVVICELSMQNLYEGQPLFHDVYQLLTGMNFQYRGNLDQMHSPLDGRVLQADGIFVKE